MDVRFARLRLSFYGDPISSLLRDVLRSPSFSNVDFLAKSMRSNVKKSSAVALRVMCSELFLKRVQPIHSSDNVRELQYMAEWELTKRLSLCLTG